jgi:hypothetical protein
MAAQRRRQSTCGAVLVCAVLLIPLGCSSSGSSLTPTTRPSQAAGSAGSTTSPTARAVSSGVMRKQPVPCPTQRGRSVTMQDITTASRGLRFMRLGLPGVLVSDYGRPDVMVSRKGTATVVWSGTHAVYSADDPSSPVDPQDVTHGGGRVPDEFMRDVDGTVGIDAADAQTLVYDDYTGTRAGRNVNVDFYDLVLFDRAPGAAWTTSSRVTHRPLESHATVAVNASGAAVVMWPEATRHGSGDGTRMWAVYRDSAGGVWTRPQRMPAADASLVGIDDAGRVLLLYYRGGIKIQQAWAIRRASTGRWERPHRIGEPKATVLTDAVGPDGSAVLTYGQLDDTFTMHPPLLTVRMSRSGTWGAPTAEPGGLGGGDVAVDGKGRALLVGWTGRDLMGRWSRPDGRWRKPFVVVANVPKPRLRESDTQIALNRRGDALIVWAKGRREQLWARYKPLGRRWSKPIKVTQPNNPPRSFDADVGDCGHAAIAWTTRTKQVQIRRFSPTP